MGNAAIDGSITAKSGKRRQWIMHSADKLIAALSDVVCKLVMRNSKNI